MYKTPEKAFLRANRKSSEDIGEVRKYWAHVWKNSGRKCVIIFWNAVVLGEHLVYKSKDDAINQGKKNHSKLSQNYHFNLILFIISTYFFVGKILGTIPKECVEDAISIIKARNEERKQKKKEEEKNRKKEKIQKAEKEREEILELLKKLLQNK